MAHRQHQPTKDERDFVRVVKFSAALGLGVLIAFLYSIKQVHPDLELEFTVGTVLAFSFTAALSWGFCSVLFKSEFGPAGAGVSRRRARRWLLFFLIISAVVTAAAFLYSLKDVSGANRRDVLEGTGIAILVLAIGGFLIHKSVRFFEEQDRASLQNQKEEEQEREESEDESN
jgi:zinc transporter ZupT